MSKGLEDLEWLIKNEYIKLQSYQEDVVALDCVDNIEQELKDLDTIKKIFDNYGLEYKLTTLKEAVFLLKQLQSEKSQCWDNALKKLKALEIWKRNPTHIYNAFSKFDTYFAYKDYCSHVGIIKVPQYIKSQKEWDLLKEVLL